MSTRDPFRSLLAEDIHIYLDCKRATGRKFNTEELALRLFDRFLSDYPVVDKGFIPSVNRSVSGLPAAYPTAELQSPLRSTALLLCLDRNSRSISLFSGTGAAPAHYLPAPSLSLRT